jgi:hypothetical protein
VVTLEGETITQGSEHLALQGRFDWTVTVNEYGASLMSTWDWPVTMISGAFWQVDSRTMQARSDTSFFIIRF